MRFKASVNNPVGLYKICQTLEKMGSTVILSLSQESVSFIRCRDYDTGIQAWIKMQPHSLFTNYRVENTRSGEINMAFRVNDLLVISRIAQQATDIQISLKRNDRQPYISWKLDSESRNGTTCEMAQELEVQIVPSSVMSSIQEPTMHPSLPYVRQALDKTGALKSVVERLKSLSKYIVLSANMNGVLKLKIESVKCDTEVVFAGLETPTLLEMEGQQTNQDPDEMASVRIASEDLSSFMNCHHLEPQNVICTITDELQLVLYVYLSIDTYQTHEAPIQPVNTAQTIMTCHIPVHFE